MARKGEGRVGGEGGGRGADCWKLAALFDMDRIFLG